MIVKDEENIIEKCLDSVEDLFDEIIIVDTGSTDKTKELVKQYTNKVYDFQWVNDFSKARNFAFSKATKEYIMWLDADDVVLKKDLIQMKSLKKNMSDDVNIYMFKYNIAFDENNEATFFYHRERLIKNNQKNKWQDCVHEFIPLNGKVEALDIAICHKKEKKEISFRNLLIYKEMKRKKKKLTPRNKYYFARELYDHQEYEAACKEFIIFLNTQKGWVEDNINACILIANCYFYMNNELKALEYLLMTLKYDLPRRKTCCLIGNHYINKNDLDKAIFWYNLALSVPINKNGFYESDYDEFIPCLNLCVSYERKKEYKLAKYYHEMTKKMKPSNKMVIKNEEYFKKIKVD